MSDSWDPDLHSAETDADYSPAGDGNRGRRFLVPVLVAVLALGAAAAVYFAFFRSPASPSSTTTATTAPAESASSRPLGAPADALDLPPLDETDPIVRKLLSELSSHPRIAAWLATDGLIRNFTAVVLNVTEGRTPASLVTVLRPGGRFAVRQSGEDLEIDASSYQRYDALADAVNSIDADGAARL